jgi:RNA polymerase sigma factor (sigma-70 family)
MDAEQLCQEYDYLVSITLHKMYGDPRKYAISKNLEYDDLMQFGRIGLFEATQTYPEKQLGTFRNFAIRNIRWYVRRSVIHDQSRASLYKSTTKPYTEINRVIPLLSMSHTLDEESDTTFYDVMSCDNINQFPQDNLTETTVLSEVEFENMLRRLSVKEKEIAIMRMNGFSYQDIANVLNVTRQCIGLKMNKIKNKLNIYREANVNELL